MNVLTAGRIRITSHDDDLTFQDREDSKRRVTIAESSLPEIVDYLRSLNPCEDEQRVGFRLPLSPSIGLKASVSYNGMTCPVRVRDISLSGILVELPPSVHELALGTSIEVPIRLGTRKATLSGIALRSSDDQYGISFADSGMDGEPKLPDSFLVILKQVESGWLRSQVATNNPARLFLA